MTMAAAAPASTTKLNGKMEECVQMRVAVVALRLAATAK